MDNMGFSEVETGHMISPTQQEAELPFFNQLDDNTIIEANIKPVRPKTGNDHAKKINFAQIDVQRNAQIMNI